MNKPLDGIRVLDLTQALNGPQCTMLLADFGAEVIKVEPPEGEMGRYVPPLAPVTEESEFFACFNRNKKSITLNLKNDKARKIFYDLVKTADVLVENYKGGVTKRLKIDYETIRQINPSIIYASGSGFGQYGPITHRPCFDAVAQAMGGMIYMTGYKNASPVKAGPSVADHVTGVYNALGVMMALYNRRCTGIGQHVDVSMLDTIFSISENALSTYSMEHRATERQGNADLTLQPFDMYEAKDGYIIIGVGSDRVYAVLCNVIDRPDLIDDPRFVTNNLRVQNYEALNAEINQWAKQHTRAEIEGLMDKASIPCGPVLSFGEAVEHPHFVAREMAVEQDHPTLGKIKVMGDVIKLSETPGSVYMPAPVLGQHTAEILNLSESEIALLKEENVM